MILRKEIGANTVRVADRVKERMAELERLNPPNTRFILDDDESEDIRRQLTDLRSRAAIAAFVIFVVLMGFLGSIRSAAVVFATIAFSILISLNLLYFMGLSLNLLTLTGLAMGFGLIVTTLSSFWRTSTADGRRAGTRSRPPSKERRRSSCRFWRRRRRR